jgi:hypothetical protein
MSSGQWPIGVPPNELPEEQESKRPRRGLSGAPNLRNSPRQETDRDKSGMAANAKDPYNFENNSEPVKPTQADSLAQSPSHAHRSIPATRRNDWLGASD